MKSATTASTEIPQPAIAIPVWPVGTKTAREPAPPRLAVELERDGHLPDRAVGADREHDPSRATLEVLAGRDVQARPAACAGRAARRRAARRARPAPGRRQRTRAGRSRRRARRAIAVLQEQLAPGGREAAALRWRRRRARSSARSASASSTRADDRDAVLVVSPARSRVEDRDDRVGAGSASRRASSCRSAGRRSGPQRGSGSLPGATPSPGSLGGGLDAVDEARRPATGRARAAGCRRGRRGRRGSRSCAPAAMPRPDSTMQPSITPSPSARAACAIRTASRIPPDLASLMLIPCATLGAGGDVGERVAVLVDVDRDRRAPLQLGARPGRRPAAAARSTRPRARQLRAAPRAPRRATRPRSRRPGAARR